MIFIKYQKYYLNLLIEITWWKQNRIDDKAILHIMKKAFYMLLNKSQKILMDLILLLKIWLVYLLEKNQVKKGEKKLIYMREARKNLKKKRK